MTNENYSLNSFDTVFPLDKSYKKNYNGINTPKNNKNVFNDTFANSALDYLYSNDNIGKTQSFLENNGFPSIEERQYNKEAYGAADEHKQMLDLFKNKSNSVLNPKLSDDTDRAFLSGLMGEEEEKAYHQTQIADVNSAIKQWQSAFSGSPLESQLNVAADSAIKSINSVPATQPTFFNAKSVDTFDFEQEYGDDSEQSIYASDANNVLSMAKPSVKNYESVYASEEQTQNPDAYEFGKDSDTFKIITDLQKRWLATDNPQERDSLHTMADEARRLAREGTPLKYGQDAVMDLLHANAKKAQRDIYFLRSLSYYNPGTDFATRVAYLISMVDKGPWDYKLHSKEWRVPYDSYNGNDMDEEGVNNRNWREWIYFDGMIMGADKLGNMNMAYVGVKLGLPHYVYQNFTTNDKDDAFWVQYGIDMAEQGR